MTSPRHKRVQHKHRCGRMLKALRHSRLDATYEAGLRKLLSVDV